MDGVFRNKELECLTTPPEELPFVPTLPSFIHCSRPVEAGW